MPRPLPLAGRAADSASLRQRLQGRRGPAYWRALEELAETSEFRDLVAREFPQGADQLGDPLTRRQVLKLMGASLALAGAACTTGEPPEEIVPYVHAAEDIVPGRPRFYATALTLYGFGIGVLVESHMGRPTKVEGNPQHPASLGASSPLAQAAILSLYDPDRSATILGEGRIQPWPAFAARMRRLAADLTSRQGEGLRILSEPSTSPTLLGQIASLRSRWPRARWHAYDAGTRDAARDGAALALGAPADPHYRLDRARVIVSLDADVLGSGAFHVRHARDFARRRRVRAERPDMCRLYAIESCPSITGALADHRLPTRAHDVRALAGALAAAVGVPDVSAPPVLPETTGGVPAAQFVRAVAADLAARRGESLVIAGDYQPPAVHALACAINGALGNIGRTIGFSDPIPPAPGEAGSLAALAADMRDGQVDAVIALGVNPVYDAPADLGFAEAYAQVPLRVHLGSHVDETARMSTWHVPMAHELESWSDVRARDGTATIQQPLIAPIFGGRTAHELLATLSVEPLQSSYDLVRACWRRRFGNGATPETAPEPQAGDDADFERRWRFALHEGVVPDTALPVRAPALQPLGTLPAPPADGSGLEVIFRPDPSVYDGRFANNGWLQELPKPLTKLTWDNAVLLAPDTAGRLGVESEQVVRLRYQGREVQGAVMVLPGHPRDAVTLHLGYGREAAGAVGSGVGFDANRLRTAAGPWMGTGLEIEPTGARYPLATTQLHHLMEGRDFVRAGTLARFLEDPDYARTSHDEPGGESLYPEWKYTGPQWGMAIDNTTCIGCNACVVACQAENNVPIVGKAEVRRQREMHWLRIDHYYAGDPDNPRSYFQPMLCQHCEKAPCEIVCPVSATAHSSDGLNQMIYNRCIGTRYCSNNCPYKVRRFNFFQYARAYEQPALAPLMNPDVTVRSRGVMEKCTYCVQRINAARIQARTAGRPLRDGDIVTACQGACPTDAIVFGDISDPESRVSRLKAQPHNYALLESLRTQPRTTYLAALRHPNPALEPDPAGDGKART